MGHIKKSSLLSWIFLLKQLHCLKLSFRLEYVNNIFESGICEKGFFIIHFVNVLNNIDIFPWDFCLAQSSPDVCFLLHFHSFVFCKRYLKKILEQDGMFHVWRHGDQADCKTITTVSSITAVLWFYNRLCSVWRHLWYLPSCSNERVLCIQC